MNNLKKVIQKVTGAKMGQYDNDKNRLYNLCQLSITTVSDLIRQIEESGMQNEQFVLDYLDTLNELSVKF